MYNYDEETSSASGCGCFRLFGFRQRRSNDNESNYLLQQNGEHRETWWKNHLNKVKQVTEVLAGPKWKTFLRKFSRFGINKNRKEKNRYQYDPESYALNFDRGLDSEDDALVLDFTSKFAAPIHDHEQPRTGSGKWWFCVEIFFFYMIHISLYLFFFHV